MIPFFSKIVCLCVLLLGVVLTLLFQTVELPAQEKPNAPQKKETVPGEKQSNPDEQAYWNFWIDRPAHEHGSAAATQLVGARDPLLMLALRAAGQQGLVWGMEEETGPLAAPTLKAEWLKHVPNNQPLMEWDFNNLAKMTLAERQEIKVFSQALIYTGRMPESAFLNSAKAHEGTIWAMIDEVPKKYQGKVIPIKGWLKRLVRKEAPPLALGEFVDHYYEGWLYTGFDEQNPVLVTFTELPKGIEPGDNLNLYIRFHGYFFKKFRYFSDKGSREGLFFMARTFYPLLKPQQVDEKAVPPLTEEWLKYVKDDKGFPDIRHTPAAEVPPQVRFEIMAYNEALINVARTPAKAFANSAQDNGWITWGHMYLEPWKYRGKVIPVKGRLKRLRKEEATIEAEKQGVKFFYEGWVYTETRGSNPVCVIFAELPPGVKVGEKIDHEVSFNGYFFKRYLYLSADGYKRTLFFFAPTFTIEETKSATLGDALPTTMLTGVAVLAVVTILLVGGLNFWFRRTDARVRAHLATVRQQLLANNVAEADSAANGELNRDPEPPIDNLFSFEENSAGANSEEGKPKF